MCLKYESVSVECRVFEEVRTVKLTRCFFFFLTYVSEYEVDSEICRSAKIVVDMLGPYIWGYWGKDAGTPYNWGK